MYLIIMPAVMVPAIAALFGLERRAHRQGLINIAAAKKGIEDEEAEVEIENKVSGTPSLLSREDKRELTK